MKHHFLGFVSDACVVVSKFGEKIPKAGQTVLVNFVTVVARCLGKCLFQDEEAPLLHLQDLVLQGPEGQCEASMQVRRFTQASLQLVEGFLLLLPLLVEDPCQHLLRQDLRQGLDLRNLLLGQGFRAVSSCSAALRELRDHLGGNRIFIELVQSLVDSLLRVLQSGNYLLVERGGRGTWLSALASAAV